jgi:hypothetical protein
VRKRGIGLLLPLLRRGVRKKGKKKGMGMGEIQV